MVKVSYKNIKLCVEKNVKGLIDVGKNYSQLWVNGQEISPR